MSKPVVLYRVVDGRWRYVGPRPEPDPKGRFMGVANIGWQESRIVRGLPHRCPKCGNVAHCDVSEHLLFDEDKLALRCRSCRHVWTRDRIPVDEVTSEDVEMAEGKDEFELEFMKAIEAFY